MKTKNFVKKLVLNKKTIAHVGKGEMTKVQGGTSPVSLDAPCNTDNQLIPTCCTCATVCASGCPFVCGP
jgi:hypothetical protein